MSDTIGQFNVDTNVTTITATKNGNDFTSNLNLVGRSDATLYMKVGGGAVKTLTKGSGSIYTSSDSETLYNELIGRVRIEFYTDQAATSYAAVNDEAQNIQKDTGIIPSGNQAAYRTVYGLSLIHI